MMRDGQNRGGSRQIFREMSAPNSTTLTPLSSAAGRRIHFAVMAIESGARKMGITGQEMHDRLKAQNLIHDRLLAFYEQLHTQSREWVADDIVETLENWEAAK